MNLKFQFGICPICGKSIPPSKLIKGHLFCSASHKKQGNQILWKSPTKYGEYEKTIRTARQLEQTLVDMQRKRSRDAKASEKYGELGFTPEHELDEHEKESPRFCKWRQKMHDMICKIYDEQMEKDKMKGAGSKPKPSADEIMYDQMYDLLQNMPDEFVGLKPRSQPKERVARRLPNA